MATAQSAGPSRSDAVQIKKDLPRTFPGLAEVRQVTPLVESILADAAACDREVGYCQGMNFPAAVLAVRFADSVAEAGRQFQEMLKVLRGLWLPGLPALQAGTAAFEELWREQLPELREHFRQCKMEPDLFLVDAWLTLFARWIPFSSLFDVVQFATREGMPAVLSITLAVLEAHATTLSNATDFTALFMLLKSLETLPQQPDMTHLMKQAAELLPAARQALGISPEECRDNSKTVEEEPVGPVELHEKLTVQRKGTQVIHAVSGVAVLVAEDAAGTKRTWREIAESLRSSIGGALSPSRSESPSVVVSAGFTSRPAQTRSGSFKDKARSAAVSFASAFGCGRRSKVEHIEDKDIVRF